MSILINTKRNENIKGIFESILKDVFFDMRPFALNKNPIKINVSKNNIRDVKVNLLNSEETENLIADIISIQLLFSSIGAVKQYNPIDEERFFVDNIIKGLDSMRFAQPTNPISESELLSKLSKEYKTTSSVIYDVYARAIKDGIIHKEDNNINNPLKIMRGYVKDRMYNTYTKIYEEIFKSENPIELLVASQSLLPAFALIPAEIIINITPEDLNNKFKSSYIDMLQKEEFDIIIDSSFFNKEANPYKSDLLIYVSNLEDLATLQADLSTDLVLGRIELSPSIINDICMAGALQHPIKTNIFVINDQENIDKDDFFTVYKSYINRVKSMDSMVKESSKTNDKGLMEIDYNILHEKMYDKLDKFISFENLSFEDTERSKYVIKSTKPKAYIEHFDKLKEELNKISPNYHVDLISDVTEITNLNKERINKYIEVTELIQRKKSELTYKLKSNSAMIRDFAKTFQKIYQYTSEKFVENFIGNLRSALNNSSFFERQSIEIVINLLQGKSNQLMNTLLYQNTYTSLYTNLLEAKKIEGYEDFNLYLDSLVSSLKALSEEILNEVKTSLEENVTYENIINEIEFGFICDIIEKHLS